MVIYSKEPLKKDLSIKLEMAADVAKELNNFELEFNPDLSLYLRLEDMGIVHTVTARDCGELIGWSFLIISPHFHYSSMMTATIDSLYVVKGRRGGLVAYKLLKATEEVAKNLGCSVLNIGVNTQRPFDRLCTKLNYTVLETIYTKRIGG